MNGLHAQWAADPVGGLAETRLDVLIVDDDTDARDLLTEAVRAMGYPCRAACDGVDAWAMHEARRANVILSDWAMPRMDGIELCRRTRARGAGEPYTYFIFMTGFADREHFAHGIDAGADDYQRKPVDLSELRARLASAARALACQERLAAANAALKGDSETSFRVARIDALTQMQNRFAMDEELRNLWSRVTRYGHRYSLAMCDVDHFKEFNDRHGHLGGDVALKRIAKTIGGALREGDGHYRFGGEEFVVLLPEQPLSEALVVMDRVRLAVEGLAIPTGRGGVVTLSLGVAELDVSSDREPADWLARADAALNRAKANGRNCVEAAVA